MIWFDRRIPEKDADLLPQRIHLLRWSRIQNYDRSSRGQSNLPSITSPVLEFALRRKRPVAWSMERLYASLSSWVLQQWCPRGVRNDENWIGYCIGERTQWGSNQTVLVCLLTWWELVTLLRFIEVWRNPRYWKPLIGNGDTDDRYHQVVTKLVWILSKRHGSLRIDHGSRSYYLF